MKSVFRYLYPIVKYLAIFYFKTTFAIYRFRRVDLTGGGAVFPKLFFIKKFIFRFSSSPYIGYSYSFIKWLFSKFFWFSDLEPRLRALLEGWGRGCIVLAYVISVSPPSLSTEKAMALEGAGPKFRPLSDVRCCAVVLWLRKWIFLSALLYCSCCYLRISVRRILQSR